MTLEQYRRLHRLTYERLAELIGLGELASGAEMAFRYTVGRSFPPLPFVRRVRDATGGAVTAEDFVDQCLNEPARDWS